MTARSKPTRELLADEMRARVLTNREAWSTLMRPLRHDFDPAEYTIVDDDRRLQLAHRDPRAIELEYGQRRLEFWSQDARAGEVRLVARRAVILARELVRRSIQPPA